MPLKFDSRKIIKMANPLLVELGIHCTSFRNDYDEYSRLFLDLEKNENFDKLYAELASLCLGDLFAFEYFILNLPVDDPFVLARTYDVQDRHNMTLDLWAREHWKSTILSYSLPIWKTINNPESRNVFFSYNKTLATKLVRRVKLTMEQNELLKKCWPDIFYENPKKESSKWSERDGCTVKRKGIYPEATFEGYGLVDLMPTGGHYTLRDYDDIVDPQTVINVENINKAEHAFRMSDNLGERGGIKYVVGTRYKYNDPYSRLILNGKWLVRTYPAEVDDEGKAKFKGIPVFMTRTELDNKFDEQGEYIYFCQMLQSPRVGSKYNFKESYKKTYKKLPNGHLNYYIVVDSAKRKRFESKRDRSDYTVMWAFAVDSLRNWYMLDGVRDKLDLQQKWDALRKLSQDWAIATIGYEQYANMTDAEFMAIQQKEEGLFLEIIELKGLSQDERIPELVPYYKKGKVLWPEDGIMYENVEGEVINLVDVFFNEEFFDWPSCSHDDMLSAHAWMLSPLLNVVFPDMDSRERPKEKFVKDPLEQKQDELDNVSIDWLMM